MRVRVQWRHICIKKVPRTCSIETIATSNNYEYQYLQSLSVGDSDRDEQIDLIFEVRAASDAHVYLGPDLAGAQTGTNTHFEVVINGGSGSTSSIRTSSQGANLVSATTTGFLNSGAFRPFWISISRTSISVGQGSDPGRQQFLTWNQGLNDISVRYIAVSTG